MRNYHVPPAFLALLWQVDFSKALLAVISFQEPLGETLNKNIWSSKQYVGFFRHCKVGLKTVKELS